MKTNELYRKSIATYGEQKQCFVAIEELSELQAEISRYLRGRGDIGCIAEEIADVKIMIEQLVKIFNCKEQVEGWRKFKLEGLEAKLNHEQSRHNHHR